MKKGVIDSNRKFQTAVSDSKGEIDMFRCYYNIHPSHVQVVREKIKEMIKKWTDDFIHEDTSEILTMSLFLYETDYFFEIEEEEDCV